MTAPHRVKQALPGLARALAKARKTSRAAKVKLWVASDPLVRKFRAAAQGRQDLVHCPVCDSTFRRFAPAGDPVRGQAQCWNCGARERHRLLWRYLQDRTDLFDSCPKRVLHLAPEQALARRLGDKVALDYVTGDLCPENPSYAGLNALRVDVTKMPFDDGSFDVILCNHLLEHVPDDATAMRELFRVLRPGGWAILQVPIDYANPATIEDPSVTDPAQRDLVFGQRDHVRWYGRDYPDRLRAAGFDVTEDDYARNLPPELLRLERLPRSELIYFCAKPRQQ
ncbi:MAG: methyltransferase domain-containing protein [Propionibacteriaceae bacterium]|jgi:SAM-dependent methyltransferase|nr:methyltransferase domain-containing protein [Propionibacteriaceae bacterium]